MLHQVILVKFILGLMGLCAERRPISKASKEANPEANPNAREKNHVILKLYVAYPKSYV